MSGSQTVTVEVIEVFPPNELVLTPNSTQTVFQGDSIVFSAKPKYAVEGEYLYMRAWVFLPDSIPGGPAPTRSAVPGCDRTCKLKPANSGVLTVYYNFLEPGDAPVDSVKVQVNVITCPWRDDPIMDDLLARNQLKRQFELSDSLRLERGGVVLQDTVYNQYSFQVSMAAGSIATECRFTIQIVTQPGYRTVGLWHTHPVKAGRRFSNCPSAQIGDMAAKGPSSWDFEAQRASAGNLPMYIIDPDDVFRVKNAAMGKSYWNKPATTTSRQWKSCPGWST